MADEHPGAEQFVERLADLLLAYPDLVGFTVVDGSYKEVRPHRWTAQLRWGHVIDLDRVAPAYRHNENRFVRPSLHGDESQPPSPLMTWWAILYTFSMLSRYRPREWAAALNIDKSPSAYLLEYSLEQALDVIPHLVMDALDGKPTLFAMPLEL